MMGKFLTLLAFLYLGLFASFAQAKDVVWPDRLEHIDLKIPPSGWLNSHEKAGGHTIKRHVAKKITDLKKRFDRSNINEASTFVSLSAAEQVIAVGLWQNIEKLAGWMKNIKAPDRLVIEANYPKSAVGQGLRRGENKLSDRFGARIVLQKSKDKKNAYILTAYPLRK